MSPPLPAFPALSCTEAADRTSSPGVAVEWMLAGEGIGLTRWRCLCGERGRSAEKAQRWYVIAFLHAGCFELRDRRGAGLVDPNWLLFYNPDQPYQTAHPHGCGDRGSALVLAAERVEEALARRGVAPENDGELFSGWRAPASTSLFARQRRLLRRIAADEICALEAEEEALGLAEEAIDALVGQRPVVGAGGTGDRQREVVERAMGYLQTRFRQPPTSSSPEQPLRLAEVAAAAGSSPSHLCAVFRRHTGAPVHLYLNRLRLRAAWEAVQTGADDLTTLALDLGFASHAHFTAAFRREFAVPPSRLRPARRRSYG